MSGVLIINGASQLPKSPIPRGILAKKIVCVFYFIGGLIVHCNFRLGYKWVNFLKSIFVGIPTALPSTVNSCSWLKTFIIDNIANFTTKK